MTDYIRFKTQVGAQAARQYLAKRGIAARLRRDPAPDRSSGCAFALYVPGGTDRAYELLRAAGLLDASGGEAG